ncbi:hypothetical protein ACHAXR_009411 [Thalassiosira sp. AJA248-18]
MKTYLLIVRNALYVSSMQHNLIPPFIMREAGLVVNDVPRIHCGDEVTRESHSIISRRDNIRIPLRLKGVFSYFASRKLTSDELENCEEMETLCLTPNSRRWNPHCDSYANNDDSFLDFRGELQYPLPKKRRLINEDEVEDEAEISSFRIMDDQWENAIDAAIAASDIDFIKRDDPSMSEDDLKQDDDPIRAHVADLSGIFDPTIFQNALNDRLGDSKLAMAAGCTMAHNPQDDLDCELFEDISIAATHAAIPKGVSKEMLTKVWGISEDEARRTLEVTTQLNKQDADSKLSRKFSTNDKMLRLRRINSFFFSDTFFVTKKAESIRGYTCMQLFVSDKGFVKVYGMSSVSQFPDALRLFVKEVGAPNAFVVDPHRAQTSKDVRSFCHKIGSTLRVLEESTQHANRAELYIGLLKESIRNDLRQSHSPLRLWCYCAERRASIFNLTAKNLFQLQGQNPHLATFGEMGDISNLCNFSWYEWCYFRQGNAAFPLNTKVLGRCLGPTKNEGNEMCQWVLQINGQIVPRRTIRRLTPGELSISNETEVQKRAVFDKAIQEKLGDSFTLRPLDNSVKLASSNPQDGDDLVAYYDDEETPAALPEADLVDATGKPINQQSVSDLLINAEVLLPQGEDMQMAKVVRRAVDEDGKLIGTFNDNPVLNSMIYDLEFPDGAIKQYAANVIAENILMQVDSNGNDSHVMDGIIGHKKDKSAVTMDNAFVV